MIDLAVHGLTHEKVLALLQSEWGIRNAKYRIDVLENGGKSAELDYTACNLECDGLGEVKYFASITAIGNDYDYRKVLLQPVMYFEYQGSLFEFPFVPLKPVTVTETVNEGVVTQEIEAYDETVNIQENSIGKVLYYPQGTVYTAAIEDLLYSAGYTNINIEPSGLAMRENREDWEDSDHILTIVNQLLEEIAYNSLSADREGILFAKKHVEPSATTARIHYAAGNNSVIGLEKRLENDGWRRPNRFVGTVFTSDMDEPWRYEYINTDPAYPASVPNLGYTISQVQSFDNVADYSTLQDNVLRWSRETAASYEYVTLRTAIMPHHEAMEAITLDAEAAEGLYEETGWRIDSFAPGGWMEHSLRRVVYA